MSRPSRNFRAALVALPFVMSAGIAATASADEASWYAGGQGSAVFQDDADANGGVTFTNEYNTGYGLGGFMGYEFGNGFRTEAELGYQNSNLDNGDGDSSALYGLASGYYDFDMGQNQPWKPYLGAGIGYADIRMDGTPAGAAAVDDSDMVPVWALSAGVGYDLDPQTTLFAGYRYLAAFEDPDMTNAAGQGFELDYATHNVEAGVRYKF